MSAQSLLRVIALCVFVICFSDASRASVAEPSPAAAGRFDARDLLSLTGIGGAGGSFYLSPDRSRIAFIALRPDFARRTYIQTWQVVDLQTRAIRNAGDGGHLYFPQNAGNGLLPVGEIGEVEAKWSPDGEWFAYLRRDADQTQVWRSRAHDGLQEPLTRHTHEVVAFAWSQNGSELYFQLGRDPAAERARAQAEADVGFLLDDRFRTSWANRPLKGECPAGRLPRTEITATCDGTVWVLDLKSGGTRAADPSEQDELFQQLTPPRPPDVPAERQLSNVVRHEKGMRWAWSENLRREEFPGYAAPLTLHADGRACPLEACTGKLSDLLWWQDEVVFIRREGHGNGLTAIYRWNPASGAMKTVLREDVLLSDCKSIQEGLICLYEAPTVPTRVVSIDLRRGKTSLLFDPNPHFSRYRLGQVVRVEWLDGFGTPTRGHLVYPPDFVPGRRYPLVIVQYRSRGFLRGGVGNEYPIFPLAAAGMLVLSFDRPDSPLPGKVCPKGSSPECFKALDRAEQDRMGPLTALERFIDDRVASGLVDPLRVGISGLSDGANTVSYALPRSTKFVAAAQSQSTSSLSLAVSGADELVDRVSRFLQPKDLMDAIARYQPESLSFHARSVTAPLLVQVSDAELVGTLPGIMALKYARKPVETYVFPGEYHIKWQPQHKLAVYERSIDWMSFWLRGVEDPAPAKVEQYKRWHSMRVKQCEMFKGDEAPWYCRQ